MPGSTTSRNTQVYSLLPDRPMASSPVPAKSTSKPYGSSLASMKARTVALSSTTSTLSDSRRFFCVDVGGALRDDGCDRDCGLLDAPVPERLPCGSGPAPGIDCARSG